MSHEDDFTPRPLPRSLETSKPLSGLPGFIERVSARRKSEGKGEGAPMRLRIGSGPWIEFGGARHQQRDGSGHGGNSRRVSAILWYVQAAASQGVSGGHASEFADLRAALSQR